MKILSIIMLLTFSVFSKYSIGQEKQGRINFTVKNSVTGIAIKSKIIVTGSGFTKENNTDTNGVCDFRLPFSRYSVQINSPGFISQSSSYVVDTVNPLNIVVSLDPVNYPIVNLVKGKSVISGYIVDEKTNLPVIGAKITSTQQNKITYTNENGYFEFSYSIFTEKGENSKIILTDISVMKNNYNTFFFSNLPLYEDNLKLNLTIKQGNGKIYKRYSHKLIEKENDETEASMLKNKEIMQPSGTENPNNGTGLKSQGACSPPAIIRLYHGASNGPCTSCSGCSVIHQMSLEQYVRTGLDDEWIASWQDASLLAGAVAYRTYGAWHVYHPYGTNYDIVAYPCRQHWDGSTSSAYTINAANSTVNEVLVNSSNTIILSEYAAETNNFGCGNCFSGQGAWPCISDNVCCGKTHSGHGRGMCQWGSHRWAQQGKNYTWILDHYYNPGGYFRCSALSSPPGAFTLTRTPECNGTAGRIRLNWTTSANATTYSVYRNNTLYSTGITGTQFINTAVTTGTTYTYYVKANNTAGSTNNSNGTVSAIAPNCSATLPVHSH